MKIKFPSLSADDIFISYSRKDANTYAVGLADELTKRGFSCFFDRLGTDADKNLPPSLIRKIKSCTMLVLVGTSAAAKSKFVTQEIDEFAQANGTSRVVPIDFGGTLANADWYARVVGIAPEMEDVNTLLSGNPTPTVVNRIEKSFKYAKSKDRLRRYTIGASAILLLLVLASVVAAYVAKGQLAQARLAKLEADTAKTEARESKAVAIEQQRLARVAEGNAKLAIEKADAETIRAQKAEGDARDAKNQALAAKTEADKQTSLAEAASKRAEGERVKAEREALNAKASGLVSIARGMSNSDPLTASLLMLEAESPSEPSGGVATARELLNQYVTKTVLMGHGKSLDDVVGIYSVAYSPDGRHVVTAGSDKTARVWSTERSGDSVVLRGHEGKLRSAEFSPDSKKVVTASEDGTTRVWNADGSGTAIVFHSASKLPVESAHFSPDGRRVLTVDGDNAARVWNADGSGTPVVLRHPERVACAVFSPDGKLIGTGSGDQLARVWNADGSGQPVLLEGHKETVIAADFSPDSKFIVTGALRGVGGGARVWPVDGRSEPVVLGDPRAQVQIVKFSPDGKKVAIGKYGDGVTLEIRAADGTGQPVSITPTTPSLWSTGGPPHTIVFSRDGKRILVSWHSGNAEIWSADGTGQPVVLRGNGASLSDAIFSPDEREIATASYDGTARIWGKSRRGEPMVLEGDVDFEAHFSPDGNRIVAAVRNGASTNENGVMVWNANGPGEPTLLSGHEDTVYKVRFSPDGSRVLTASFDGTARVWASDGSGTPVVLAGHGGPVYIAEFSPDGSHILTVTNAVQDGEYFKQSDGTLRVWTADGARTPLVLKGHRGAINSAFFSPDGKRIVTAGADGTIRIWRSDQSGEPMILKGHKYGAVDARFDATGKRLVSVAEDKTAMIWNLDNSGEPTVWRAGRELKSAEFSPDGKRIVILAKNHNDVFLWNADGVGEPTTLRVHTGAVNTAKFSKDGKYLVTTSGDGSARLLLADGTGEALVLQSDVRSVVSWAEFSPDSSRVLTVTYPRVISEVTARVWTVGWGELIKQLRERTGECLSTEQRIKYLSEAEDLAKTRFSECKLRFGRASATE